MAWNQKTVASARELLEYVQRMATAKHVSALAVNAGGTGYVDGDILKITHAGAHLDCTFVVGVTAGAVSSIKRIRDNGAFTNRMTAVTVHAGDAGSGYAVNDIVQVLGGTFTSPAKLKITGAPGGNVTTVAVFEGGGAYSTPPANQASTDATIGTGTGTALKVDMTFSGLIGTTGIGSTAVTGVGTGATFNITLTDTGHSVQKSVNNYSFNSIADEKELVLKGTGGTGASDPYIGFRSFTDGVGARMGVTLSPMTAFNSLLAYDSQPNILTPIPATTGGQMIQLGTGGSNAGYLSITPRKIAFVYTAVGGITVDHFGFAGLLDPSGTVVEQPFPCAVIGSCSSIAIDSDSTNESDISGPTCLYKRSTRTGPAYVWSQPLLAWQEMKNGEVSGASPPYTVTQDRGTFPIFKPRKNFTGTASKGHTVDDGSWSFHSTIGRADGGAATHALKPTPDSGGEKQALVEVHVLRSLDVAGITNGGVDGRLPNVFFLSSRKADGSNMTPGASIFFGNDEYVLFRNGKRATSGYDLFAMKVGN